MNHMNKNPSFIFRLLTHTILLIVIAQITGSDPNQGWFFEYGQNFHLVALGNIAYNLTPWLVAYIFSLLCIRLDYHYRVFFLLSIYSLLIYLMKMPYSV